MTNLFNELTFSAVRSILAYSSGEDIHNFWLSSKEKAEKTKHTNIDSIFENVPTKPHFYKDDRTNVLFYSYKLENILYITFRGTNEHHEKIPTLDTSFEHLFTNRNKHVFIQNEFSRQFYILEYAIAKEIEKYIDYIDTVHFAGHSLGGALAIVSSAYFGYIYKEERQSNLRVICHTFGSPRVGNSHFVTLFHKYVRENIRIVNEGDAVPTLPVSRSFTHISDALTINANLEINIQQEPTWFWRFITFPIEIKYEAPIPNHSCIMYFHRILSLSSLHFEETDDVSTILKVSKPILQE